MANGIFDQPSAITWRFFIDIAMETAPTYEKLFEIVVSIPKDPPPTSWPKRTIFVNRQRAGEAILEGLQMWIRPNTDMQKPVNLYFGAFCGIFYDIATEMAPIRAHLSW